MNASKRMLIDLCNCFVKMNHVTHKPMTPQSKSICHIFKNLSHGVTLWRHCVLLLDKLANCYTQREIFKNIFCCCCTILSNYLIPISGWLSIDALCFQWYKSRHRMRIYNCTFPHLFQQRLWLGHSSFSFLWGSYHRQFSSWDVGRKLHW